MVNIYGVIFEAILALFQGNMFYFLLVVVEEYLAVRYRHFFGQSC